MTEVNAFETTQRLASFHNWPHSPYSPVIIVKTGFSYTGNGFLVECKFCKERVDMSRVNNVISLADRHDNSCRRKTNPQDNVEIQRTLHGIGANVEEGTNNQNNHASASSFNDDAHFNRRNTTEHREKESSEHICVETTSEDTTIVRSGMVAQPTNEEPEPEIPQRIVITNERVCSDLSIYSDYQSIKSAPCCCCPCWRCRYNNTIPIVCGRNKTCMFGIPKINVRTLMLRLRERVSSGPLHPKFNTLEVRKRNLKGIIASYSCVAEAVFFADSSCGKERICCFYCDGNLRNQLLSNDPFREHTRWFPVCPFILQQKGEDYIHTVSQDTKILKTFLKNKMRTSCMDTNVVVEAMQVYPQYAIGKIVEEFFIDNGYFPGREDLFESLENFQLWKTSETYDYCRSEDRS